MLMSMPLPSATWTAEMVLALPDDGLRHEVVDGEHLVTPAPTLRHQAAARALFVVLYHYLDRVPVGSVFESPADIRLDPQTLIQPDVFVVALIEGREPKTWAEISDLLLVIEVLSPSTARVDRGRKRLRYMRSNVAEYWIVDLDSQLVERWLPGEMRPEIVRESLTWQPDPASPPLVVDLPAFFAGITGGS
jgi:Uma2 family endonuclease